jgi:hypothetical protein
MEGRLGAAIFEQVRSLNEVAENGSECRSLLLCIHSDRGMRAERPKAPIFLG